MDNIFESQLEARARLNAEKTERAYADLAASVSSSGTIRRGFVDDVEKTDRAVRACLKYVGVEPGDAPDNIEDLDERLDWFCRPSGTMHRAVKLDDGWQKEAFGAMLGRLDTGEAVALIPRGVGGYWYFDPVTNEKVKVSSMDPAKSASSKL